MIVVLLFCVAVIAVAVDPRPSPRPRKGEPGRQPSPKTPRRRSLRQVPRKTTRSATKSKSSSKRSASGGRPASGWVGPSSIAAQASRVSQKRLRRPSRADANRSCCGQSEPATATGPSRRKPSSSLPASTAARRRNCRSQSPRLGESRQADPRSRRAISRCVPDDDADADRSGQFRRSRRAPAPGPADRRGRRGAGANSVPPAGANLIVPLLRNPQTCGRPS